jgi:hypothetical protein
MEEIGWYIVLFFISYEIFSWNTVWIRVSEKLIGKEEDIFMAY